MLNLKFPKLQLTKNKKVSLEKSTDESNSENQIPEQKKQKKALDFLKLELPTLSLRKKTDSQKTKSQNTNVNKSSTAGIAIYADALYCTLPNEKKQEIIPLEAGCIQNSTIRDFTLLENAFKKLSSLTKSPVVIGLPPGDIIMRPVAFPEMNQDDLKSTIDLNFEEYFPFSREEAVLDFTKINIPSNPNIPNVSNRIHVLIAASRRSCIEGILNTTSNAGLKLEAIEPCNIASLRVIPESHEDLCLVADVNEYFASVTVSWDGECIFFRASNRGNDIDALTNEILNTAQFAENQYRGFTIKKIILTGKEFLTSGLFQFLETRAEVLNMPSDFISSDGLSKRDSKGIYIDLRPRAYLALQKRLHSFNINRVALMTLTGAFFILSGSSIALSLLKANKVSQTIQLQRDFINSLQNQLNALQNQNGFLHAQQNNVVQVLDFVRDDMPVLEVLSTLEANTGVGIEFRSINFGRDKSGFVATLEAVAENEDLIISMTDNLSQSDLFKNIIMPGSTKNENEKINFSLILNIADIMR